MAGDNSSLEFLLFFNTYTCAKCGEENADRNAAFNIAYRALDIFLK